MGIKFGGNVDLEQGELVADVNTFPIWQTAGGSLGSMTEVVTLTSLGLNLFADDVDGPNPITYEIVRGTLPTGGSLDINTGAITGPTVSVSGNTSFRFTVRAFDGLNFSDREFSIEVINNLAPSFNTSAGNLATITTFETITSAGITIDAVDTDGIGGPVTYSISSGTPPTGLVLDPNTGVITGPTVAAEAVYSFAISATDGLDTNILNVSWTVAANTAPVFTVNGGNLGSIHESETISSLNASVVATDADSGPSTITYSVTSGSLPVGAILDMNTGAITGPTVSVASDTTYTFKITATDGDAVTESNDFTIIVDNNTQPIWSTAAGNIGTVGEGEAASGISVLATDSDSNPSGITYSVSAGALPTGLTLNPTTGAIVGTVGSITEDTTFAFTIEATDGLDTASRAFDIDANVATFEAGAGLSETGRTQEDANNFSALLNDIYGTGTGTGGYGQGDFTVPTVDQEVTVAELTSWRTALGTIAAHQGITLSPALPALSLIQDPKPLDAVTFYNGLKTNLTQCELDPTLQGGAAFSTGAVPGLTGNVRTTAWSDTVTHLYTLSFTDSDEARAFFNTGGQFILSASRTGGAATTQNTDWTTLLSNAGTTVFDSAAYFALTSSFTTLDSEVGTGAYSANVWTLEAQRDDAAGANGGNGSIIRIRLTFADNHAAIGAGPDTIDGTLTSNVDIRLPTTLSIANPTYTVLTSL